MNGYVVLFIVITLVVGVILGVSLRYFDNFGANIAKNHLKELGVDFPDEEDDLRR